MNMPISKLAAAILALLVLGLVFIGILLLYKQPNETFFDTINKFIGQEDTKPQRAEIKEKTYIGDTFLAEFESCIKSQDTDCYCPFTNTFIPKGMKLAFVNDKEKSSFLIYADNEEACEVPSGEPVKSTELEVKLYVEDAYGRPDLTNNKLDHSDFSKATAIFIAGKELCSAKDVIGSDDIDFTYGIVYKIDKNNIALTRNQEGLRRCTPEPMVASD